MWNITGIDGFATRQSTTTFLNLTDFTFDCYCSIITTLLWCYCKPIAPQKNQQSFMLLYFIIN
jgi:hypothetical protein